jgi:hypothetical protein
VYNTLIVQEIFMMIYVRNEKSKKKLGPKAVREQYDAWLKSHQSSKPIKSTSNKLTYNLSAPAGRETVRYPSLNTGNGVATKSAPKVYTGDKVLGIATLHKSNAVPVFNNTEAVEISKMRR